MAEMISDGKKRFEEIFHQRDKISKGRITDRSILKDLETGVLYCQLTNSQGTSFTVMVDRDGKPLVDK